jgi:hypothetical protein
MSGGRHFINGLPVSNLLGACHQTLGNARMQGGSLEVHAISIDDRPHFDRMMRAWYESVVEGGEPVVWVGCIEILRYPARMTRQMLPQMVVTLSEVAEV